jgi:DNA-binding transcriptional ArsR family regulator
MVDYKGNDRKLDLIFHALADATRRKILVLVAEKERSVSDLAKPFDMSLAAVSKHLKVLEAAGLLKRTVEGRVHRCGMNVEPLTRAQGVIADYQKFWAEKFDQLESFLKDATLNESFEPLKKEGEQS